MDYISEHIIFNILTFLPVLSLVRLKTVCKLWYSIISSPQFLQTHLSNSYKRQPSVLRYAVHDMFIDTREDSVRLNMLPHYYGMDMITFVRSVNGIVCLANVIADVIYLCNPSTNMFKILPKPELKAIALGVTLGFGFDSVGNDYKIVRIVVGNNSNGVLVRAEMYSENAASWKRIEAPEIVQTFCPYSIGTCIEPKKGVLCLEGYRGILSFDLHNEVLGVYPYPNPIHEIRSNLLDFQGSAAMIFESLPSAATNFQYLGHKPVLSLWMLDDVCGQLIWTKKFDLEAASEIDWTVLYLGSGHFVSSNNNDGYIFYDYKKKEIKKFSHPAPIFEVISVAKYTDTLVSLQGFQQLQ